jgi:hypothetical protein
MTVRTDNLDTFFQERERFLVARSLSRGHFYPFTSMNMMGEHRPDVLLAHYNNLRIVRSQILDTGTETSEHVPTTVNSLGHLPMYVNYGWETGIFNEFRHLQERGLTRDQIMELVLYGQLQAGIRGLQHAYNAVSKLLPGFEPNPAAPPWMPQGWAPDNAAFHAGLDLTQRSLTGEDRKNLNQWFEKTIGYVPGSVQFAIEFHPEFYKWHRARWEVIFQKLPKQAAPYVMIRINLIAGFEEGLREAVLLGKAWGMKKVWAIEGLMCSAFYTGFDALYAADKTLNDVLDDPSW